MLMSFLNSGSKTQLSRMAEIMRRTSRAEITDDDLRDSLYGNVCVRIAVVDGLIVGVLAYSLEKTRRSIHILAVDPDWQGRGIGSALLETLRRSMAANQATKIDVVIPMHLQHLVPFFKSSGFHVAGMSLGHVLGLLMVMDRAPTDSYRSEDYSGVFDELINTGRCCDGESCFAEGSGSDGGDW